MAKKTKARKHRARFMSKEEMRELGLFIAAIIKSETRRKKARSRKE